MRKIPFLVCQLSVVALLGVVPATLAGEPQRPAGSSQNGESASRVPPGPNLSGLPLGGVPSGDFSATPIALTLDAAVARGLRQNLSVLAQEAAVEWARGNRWRTMSDLLPKLSARMGGSRQQTNLAAFGISLPGVPTIVGPFNVFDARLYASQALMDLDALYSARSGAASLRAEEFTLQNARELVVLVVRSLYLQTVAAESRLKAVRAQTDTALVLYNLAADLKTNGVVAGVDVLRAQVQLQTQRHRAIVAANDFEKQKLQLARAIGLPIGQAFTLADAMPYEPLQAMTLDEALRRAYESREDYRAAQTRVEAAQAAKRAALGDTLPSVHVSADYGSIGRTVSDLRGTYSVVTQIRIPIFDAAAVRGRVLEADALLRQRQSELADFRARIDCEVRTALLDLNAAEEQLQVAQTMVTLANQELTQSQDRFAAGVAGNIEVVQSQEAVATATESYIAGLYAHNIAKASIARAIGLAADAWSGFLGGRR